VIRLARPVDHSGIDIVAQLSEQVTSRMGPSGARSRDTFERKENHAQRLEPPTDSPGFSQGLGHVPASPWKGISAKSSSRERGTDASPTCTCDAGPGSLRGFPQFEHGAGI